MTQLGKYSSDRDSALHYLCTYGWSNDSFGDVEAPTGYVWRISNTWDDVKPENTEFNSVITDWVRQEDVIDTEDFYRALVGHFLITEDSNGSVHVLQCDSAADLESIFKGMQAEYEAWDGQDSCPVCGESGYSSSEECAYCQHVVNSDDGDD